MARGSESKSNGMQALVAKSQSMVLRADYADAGDGETCAGVM